MAQVSGIYIILNTKNGKVYLGQAVNLSRRRREHFSALRCGGHHNRHLQRAWNKYGEKAFRFKVLEYCPIEQLNEREQHHITIYRARGMAYNLTDGGDGASNPSAETRQKISEANEVRIFSEETRQKISEAKKGNLYFRGHTHSVETRQKISEARKGQISWNKGKSPSVETRQKMSAAHKGKIPWNKGKKLSAETCLKISEAKKRRHAMKRGETIEG